MGSSDFVERQAQWNGVGSPSALHLAPPRYAFNAVQTRAFAALAEKEPTEVTIVAAPPGYGKTVLLAELFRNFEAKGRRCFWIGIDSHDGAQRSPLSALEHILDIEPHAVPEAMNYRIHPTVEQRIDAIAERLSADDTPVYIFIDNADLACAEETQHLLNHLIFDHEKRCFLLISCGAEVPFDTTRALLELRSRRFGVADLAFDSAQISTLFREAGIQGLSPDASEHILAQSEGWPAAVRLMQVLSSTTPDAAGDFGRLSWEGERHLDSLFDSLIERLPDDLKRFLAEISFFASFTLDLGASATQSERASDFLRYLVDHNILIVSLDQQGRWFRFHTLFKRYLTRVADAIIPGERRQLVKRRGAQWLERHGNIEASLEIAIEIEDKAMATRLLEKLSWSLVRSRGHLPIFIEWAERARRIGCQLGEEASFWFAWALIFQRRYEDALRAISDLMQRLENADGQDPPRLSPAKAGLAQIVLNLHMDDLKSIQSVAPGWLENDAGTDPFEKGAAAGALALALLADHEFSAARSAARTSLSAVGPTNSIYGRAWASNISAAIALASCNADRVEEALWALESEIRDDLADDALIAGVTAVVRARALYERGEQDLAVELAQQHLPIVRTCGMLDFVWLAFEILAPAAILRPDSGVSLTVLRQIAAEYPKRLSVMLDLTIIRTHCNAGQIAPARELGERLGVLDANGRFSMPADFELAGERAAAHLAGIALTTALGDLKSARHLIDGELHQARARSRRGAVVELYLAQAAVEVKSGQQPLATRAYSRAINFAAECRAIRPFIEQRALVSHLHAVISLKELGLATDATRQLFDEVGRLVGDAPSRPSADVAVMLAEPLTKRELELLRMLDAGMDNAQISGLSGISVRTVKWHLRNLYGKLAVKNRTSAIARGRHLQLL